MVIYLIINNNIYNIIIEYCTSLHKKISNSKIIYIDEFNECNSKNIYIFFGLHYVNYPIINSPNIYYINLEQLTMDGSHSKYNMLENVINKTINLLDYSQGNINILTKYNIQSKYIPYQVNFDEVLNYTKIYDICMCCSYNERIGYIYNAFITNNSHCIGNPSLWGKDRDDILFRSKILINIHHREKDYNILEEIRITRCILNKIIVISEYSLDYEKYPLSKYIIYSNYDNIISKVSDVLSNYDSYYNDCYKDFNINEIDDILSKYIYDFIHT